MTRDLYNKLRSSDSEQSKDELLFEYYRMKGGTLNNIHKFINEFGVWVTIMSFQCGGSQRDVVNYVIKELDKKFNT